MRPNRSGQSIDGVVDVAVGFSGSIARKAMVRLDVLQSFHIPGGGELKSTVDFGQTSNQIVIHGAGTTSHQAVGDHAQVVAHVTRTLGLAFWGC